MTTLDCNEARSHLPLHAGGDLESPLSEAMGEHLASCRPCAERLEAALRSRRALLTLRDEGAAPAEADDLWPAIRMRLAEEGLFEGGRAAKASAEVATVPLRSLARFRLLTGAAAAIVLALLAWRPWVPVPDGTGGPPEGEIRMGLGEVARPDPAAAIPASNGLRRAGPGDELLRDSARDLRLRQGRPARNPGVWSLASDELITEDIR